MRKLLAALLLFLLPATVLAQSSPNWSDRYVPTADEVNMWWAKKLDLPACSGPLSWNGTVLNCQPAPVGGVTSVAGKTGAVILNHNDLTDWAIATGTFTVGPTPPVVAGQCATYADTTGRLLAAGACGSSGIFNNPVQMNAGGTANQFTVAGPLQATTYDSTASGMALGGSASTISIGNNSARTSLTGTLAVSGLPTTCVGQPIGTVVILTGGALTVCGTAGPPTISSIQLSNNNFPGGSGDGTIVGTISTTVSSGTFSGTYSGPGGTDGSKFRIAGSNLVLNGTQPAGSYSITITGTDASFSNSPFTSVAIPITGTAPPATINAVALSPTNFIGGSASGTIVGTLSTTVSAGSFGGTYGPLGGTNPSQFQIVNGNQIATNGVAATGTYSVTVRATDAAFTNSPFTSAPITISGTTAGPTITAVSLSPSSFPGNSASGTAVGDFTTIVSSGTFTGGYGPLGGTDSGRFVISPSGSNHLLTNGVQPPGTYSITVRVTDTSFSNSPFTSAPITITATAVTGCTNSLDFSQTCNLIYLPAAL